METALTTGQASVEFYRPDFRVVSIACSWFGDEPQPESLYLEGEEAIGDLLSILAARQYPIIVHNVAFEYGVLLYRFPGVQLNYLADTMRLTQLADGGKLGLGLESCVRRWLPDEHHDHKAPYYAYLRETHGVKPKKEGAHLHLLPPEMLQAYNTADTDVTLRLYERLAAVFAAQDFDWKPDHALYLNTAYLVSQARGAGVLVDREGLANAQESLKTDLIAINQAFRTRFAAEIEEIESQNLTKFVTMRKSERGQVNAWAAAIDTPSLVAFKTTSPLHKERLFCTRLQITPKFFTPSGKPSFAKALLRQWGEGGDLLIKRGTIFQAYSQVKRLAEKSELDGRWHISLRVAGTVTGRLAGGDGLNIQAMARREKRLMGSILPDPGHVFVSVDLSAGEPSVITHFSKDPYYRAAIFDMVGKAPYYDADGVLMIDDIYLMGMSISPMGRDTIRQVFDNETFNGMSFSQAWLVNADLIKTRLKAERAFHKILILGIGYAMGPDKMALSAFKQGFDLTPQDARKFFKAYWGLISQVKDLNDTLTDVATKTGYLINPFGYRCVPDPLYKSLNYFIQSSINGLIAILCAKFFTICQDAKFVTIIHDEILFQIPIEKAEAAKELMDRAVDSLNDDLGWTVKIRTGWVTGKDMYEAK